MVAQVQYRVENIEQVLGGFRKARRVATDLEPTFARAAKLLQAEAVKRAPHQTGRLERGIIVTTTKSTGRVIGLGAVPYMGVIHFGWVTRNVARGFTRKEAQARFSGALTRRSINKTVAGNKARVTRRAGQVVGSRGAVRGGPIKPNPFLYLAQSDQERGVFQQFDELAEKIAAAANK